MTLPSTIHWRFSPDAVGHPGGADAGTWFTPQEHARAHSFTVEKRRRDWVLGRLNLKALIVDLVRARYALPVDPAHLLIGRRPSGAPFVQVEPEGLALMQAAGASTLPLSVSNSHSHERALAAALWTDTLEAEGWLAAVGADLEWVEPRSEGFVRDFLTAPERRYWEDASGADRDLRANLVWSAKEAVLKVLQRGLSADTWWLTCLPTAEAAEPSWGRFTVSCDDRLGAQDVAFEGWWRRIDGFVATLAVGLKKGSRTVFGERAERKAPDPLFIPAR